MAEYQLAEHGSAFVVSIVGYDGPRLPLLRAFDACRDGRCGCATDQIDHFAGVDADELDGRIELTLHARPGARLDREAVARSLEETLTRYQGMSV
ncbi:MAG TPA: hypothetical protein VKA86_15920 [Candidatus Krumholzibacteria bacterium]|nr:hypothetical protein [Candidatus Krumholzibacteria bacterium]